MSDDHLGETDLLWLFIRQVPFDLPHVRIERRNIIRGAIIGKTQARVSNGIPGQADSFAMIAGGHHVEIETKSATGPMRAAQKRWRDFCAAHRIPHLVLRARAGEASDATIARWIEELRAVLPKNP